MTASISVSQVLPGVHRVRKRRTDGGVTEFWYAWRGGPQIMRAVARSDALLAREVSRLTPAAMAAYEAERRPGGEQKFLYGLITRYLASNEFEGLAPRTKKDRRKFLDKARAEIGEMELRALEARGARAALIEWRDQSKATPKTADELLGAVGTVLEWARDAGAIGVNPAKDFPRIYRSNRAEVIWRPEDLARLYPHCAEELNHAVRLAIHTGLRLSDLIILPWSAIGEHAIVWQTGKSRGRRTVVVPITPPLRKLIAEIPRRATTTVLTSARKRPWTAAGLDSAFRRAKLDAGIEGLRFHDLRGTAATTFIQGGLDLGDVATILGWKKTQVEDIAARYVTAEAIGLAMVERLRRNTLKTKAVNRVVNRASVAPPKAG